MFHLHVRLSGDVVLEILHRADQEGNVTGQHLNQETERQLRCAYLMRLKMKLAVLAEIVRFGKFSMSERVKIPSMTVKCLTSLRAS